MFVYVLLDTASCVQVRSPFLSLVFSSKAVAFLYFIVITVTNKHTFFLTEKTGSIQSEI